jgi:hypothetical protein
MFSRRNKNYYRPDSNDEKSSGCRREDTYQNNNIVIIIIIIITIVVTTQTKATSIIILIRLTLILNYVFLIFISLYCTNHGIKMLKCLSYSRLPEGLSVETAAGDWICRNYPLRFSPGNVMRSDTQKKFHIHRGCATNALYMIHWGTQSESNLWYQHFLLSAQYFHAIYRIAVPAIRSMITISRSDYCFMGSNGRMMCYKISAKSVISIPRIRYGSSGLLRNVRNKLPDYTKLQWKWPLSVVLYSVIYGMKRENCNRISIANIVGYLTTV